MKYIYRLFISFVLLFHAYLQAAETEYLQYVQTKVQESILEQTHWDGPVQGPTIKKNKTIVFIASDLRNGGVNSVANGFSEAISHIDWDIHYLDGKGSKLRQGAAIRKAINMRPDGIVLGGIDAFQHANVLKIAKNLGISIVGWHAIDEAKAEPNIGLFTNITTDPTKVAEIAVLFAIADSGCKAKVIIFTDPNYSIASLKTNSMIEHLKKCMGCELLSVEEVPLDEIAKQMPIVMDNLLAKYANNITHFLAINDLYIDFATPSLEERLNSNFTIPLNISAGDGSRAAYKRIRIGNFQLATVPEPLYLQGWQIVDELNRSFYGMAPSGYSAPVLLMTQENVNKLIGNDKPDVYDPQNGYREAYLTIWSKP